MCAPAEAQSDTLCSIRCPASSALVGVQLHCVHGALLLRPTARCRGCSRPHVPNLTGTPKHDPPLLGSSIRVPCAPVRAGAGAQVQRNQPANEPQPRRHGLRGRPQQPARQGKQKGQDYISQGHSGAALQPPHMCHLPRLAGRRPRAVVRAHVLRPVPGQLADAQAVVPRVPEADSRCGRGAANMADAHGTGHGLVRLL